jgi:DNA-directed RNA polymerase specialized sigma subunit
VTANHDQIKQRATAAIQQFIQEYGRKPTRDELAEYMSGGR